jgi:hypothetical protein
VARSKRIRTFCNAECNESVKRWEKANGLNARLRIGAIGNNVDVLLIYWRFFSAKNWSILKKFRNCIG